MQTMILIWTAIEKAGPGGGGIPRQHTIDEAQNIQTSWSKKEKDTNCPDLAISRKSGGMALLAPPLLFSFCQLREAQKPKKSGAFWLP